MLLYWLEQGPTEKAILLACARDRTPVPMRIQNAPELMIGLEIYYVAFLNLTTCRTDGVISWKIIDDYADRIGFSEEQREDLFYFIPYLDAVYQNHREAKKPQPTKSPKTVPKTKVTRKP